jgi:NAD(P)-dependent dehydrogenase (short-subunit alcohol dehydrogenase family)
MSTTTAVPSLRGFGPDDLPDLSGTRAVVTGANSGIGLETAKALAEHGAEVVLACRKVEAGEEAAARISGTVGVEALDLASLDSVRAFAERYDGPLDLLVNNAGVMMAPRYRATADGFELQIGTNHLGHFALGGLLLPNLLQAQAPRIVPVSSIFHRDGDGTVLQGNPESSYNPSRAYGNSKLANLLYAAELQRRATAAASPLVVAAAHPGVSSTGLVTSRDGLGARPLVRQVAPLLMPLFLQSAKAGANPSLWAATYGEPGSYVGPQWLRESRGPLGQAKRSRSACDPELAVRLWEWSERQTGVSYNFNVG